jgi:hypothetical protein
MKNHWLEEKEEDEKIENTTCTIPRKTVTVWAGRKIEFVEGDFEFNDPKGVS